MPILARLTSAKFSNFGKTFKVESIFEISARLTMGEFLISVKNSKSSEVDFLSIFEISTLGKFFILGNNSKWIEVDSSTIFEILANTVEVLSLSSDYVPTNVTI